MNLENSSHFYRGSVPLSYSLKVKNELEYSMVKINFPDFISKLR